MSRTRLARLVNWSSSRLCLPNSFTTNAPATLNRSATVLFIEALRYIPSRVMPTSLLPIRRAGMMNAGSTSSVRIVKRHSSPSITVSVTAKPMTFETTVPNVFVIACCAPMTSLFIRDISAPVWARVKNDTGWRCTWSNSAVRRSKIKPSPMRAEYQRCHRLSSAFASARPTAATASHVTRARFFSGTAVSRSERNRSGGITVATDAAIAVIRKPTSWPR